MRQRAAHIVAGCALAAAMLAACAKAEIRGGPVPERLHDGVYEGAARSWPNRATVKVTVEEGRIVRVDLLSHVASWIGKKASQEVPARIIEKQSTDVDAVTGATNSSRVIMNAVQDAVDRAAQRTGQVD